SRPASWPRPLPSDWPRSDPFAASGRTSERHRCCRSSAPVDPSAPRPGCPRSPPSGISGRPCPVQSSPRERRAQPQVLRPPTDSSSFCLLQFGPCTRDAPPSKENAGVPARVPTISPVVSCPRASLFGTEFDRAIIKPPSNGIIPVVSRCRHSSADLGEPSRVADIATRLPGGLRLRGTNSDLLELETSARAIPLPDL